ncbi:MAG TPA: hypothetical protein VM008_09890 [Phycisphaerae bacterium]|nr:hypothetical protein [Phycisphaerae bacterium]
MSHPAISKAAEVLPVLDQLHRLEVSGTHRPTVEVRLSTSHCEEGSYRVRTGAPDLPERIFISRNASWPRLTFLHEVAHYLDNQWMHPLKQGFASTYDDDFLLIKSIWNATATISNLRWLLNKYRARMALRDRQIFVETLLDNEIWARCYSQWAVMRSDNYVILGELENALKTVGSLAGHNYTIQWPAKEFTPLAEAVDNLLKVKKLI